MKKTTLRSREHIRRVLASSAMPVEIGKAIADARERAGLKQGRLAEMLGWDQGRLSHYETGQRKAGIDEVVQIASALGIRTSTLIDGLDRPIPADQLTIGELFDAIRTLPFTQDQVMALYAELAQAKLVDQIDSETDDAIGSS